MESSQKEIYLPLVDRLADTARELYDDSLPYHNFAHAVEVLNESMRLADLCTENGIYVNRRVLAAAALLHDANYYQDSANRFKTKEEYSQYIARNILPFFDYDIEEIELVEDCIKGTELGMSCTSIEAKIIRRADIGNVSRNREELLAKTLAFSLEEIQMKGLENIDWDSIVNKAKYVFGIYLEEDDLRLGDFEPTRNGKLCFIADCLDNIDSMARETRDTLIRIGKVTVENIFGKITERV